MEQYVKKLKENGLSLRPHQVTAVEAALWWRESGHGGIIADEMGLGKTCEAVALLSIIVQTEKKRPHLIVCPLSVVDHWEKELNRFGCGKLEVVKFMGVYTERRKISKHLRTSKDWNVVLTTYEQLYTFESPLTRMKWRTVILDEAQKIKSINARINKGFRRMKMDYTLILTGTPLQNNMLELFGLLCVIDKKKYPVASADEFIRKYGQTDSDRVVKEVQNVLSKYMIRRMKSEIAIEIPPSSHVVLYHGMSPMQRDLYKALLSKKTQQLVVDQKYSKSQLLNLMMQLRKCVLHPYLFPGMEPEPFTEGEHIVAASDKLMLLDRLLVFLKRNKHRVLIFSQMVRMLDVVHDFLRLRGWNMERIDGSITGSERYEAVNNFQRDDSKAFCFLLSTRAGGLGLTLTGADTVIFIDSDFNPQNDIQAAARCHRIGQDKPVKIIRLTARNTVEDVIERYASRKLRMTNRVLEDEGGDGFGKLTSAELSNMILHGLRQFAEEDANTKPMLTESEIEDIIGKTDSEGHWIQNQLEENEANDNGGDENDDKHDEAVNIYNFEGHDYKKDRKAFEKLVEMPLEGQPLQARPRFANYNEEELKRLREELNERKLKEKKEKTEKDEQIKLQLWTDNDYVSTNLELPSDSNEGSADQPVDGTQSDTYYGPYFVGGDVTKPTKAPNDQNKHDIIVHFVDYNIAGLPKDSVFNALHLLSPQVAEVYKRAFTMKDRRPGDAHLIENVGHTDSVAHHSASEREDCSPPTSSFQRRLSVVLVVAAHTSLKRLSLDNFIVGLKRLAPFALETGASVHMPQVNPKLRVDHKKLIKAIREHLTHRRVHTYIYRYCACAGDGRSQVAVKRGITVESADGQTNDAGPSSVVLAKKKKHDGNILATSVKTEGIKRERMIKKGSSPSKGKKLVRRTGSGDKENCRKSPRSKKVEDAYEEEEEDSDVSETSSLHLAQQDESENEGDHWKFDRMKRQFKGLVIWVHALPKHKRTRYANLIAKHGGDLLEKNDCTDLATHAVFDEELDDGGKALKKLRATMPDGCWIVSKQWIDTTLSDGVLARVTDFALV